MSLESFERFWRDVGEEEAYTDTATRLELLRLYDFPLHQDGDTLTLSTASLPLQEAVFCFVDIETTGGKASEHDVIEIGALKYQNGKIIDRFESLIFTSYVPSEITALTGIRTQDLLKAPQPQEILTRFRNFVRGSVFVAHNVSFDFTTIKQDRLTIFIDAITQFITENKSLAFLISNIESCLREGIMN